MENRVTHPVVSVSHSSQRAPAIDQRIDDLHSCGFAKGNFMAKRMQMTVGVLALLLSTGAKAQSTADATAVAECRLDSTKSAAVLASLPVLSTEDMSFDDVEAIDEIYASDTVAPFGLRARSFSTHYQDDGFNVALEYRTELRVGYDDAKRTILSALGMAACAKEVQPSPTTRVCSINARENGLPARSLTQRLDGSAIFECFV